MGKIGIPSKRKGFYYIWDEILWGEVLLWLRLFMVWAARSLRVAKLSLKKLSSIVV